MLTFSRNRLARSLFIKTILATLSVSFFIGLLSCYISLKHYSERQQDEINHLLDSAIPSFSYAVANPDLPLGEDLLAALLQHPSIQSVILSNINNHPLISHHSGEQCSLNAFERALVPAENIFIRNLQLEQQALGKIIVHSNSCLYQKRLYSYLKMFAAYTVLFSLIIAVFIALLLYRNIARPIGRLVRTIDTIKVEDLSELDIKGLQSKRGDELGIAINQFAKLLVKIKHELSIRQKNELTIQEYSQRLEALISKRTTVLTDLKQQLQEIQKKNDFDLLVKQYYFELASAAGEPLEALIQLLSDHPEASSQLKRFNQLRTFATILSNNAKEKTAELIDPQNVMPNFVDDIKATGCEINCICDIDEELFIVRDYLNILLPSLLSNAAFYSNKPLLLHCFKKDSLLYINLSSVGLNIPPADRNLSLLPNNEDSVLYPSPLGLGLVSVLCQLMGGQLQLNNFSLEGQTLCCTLPYQSASAVSKALQQNFSALPVSLQVENGYWRKEWLRLLQHWKIPYNSGHFKEQQVLITDEVSTEHNAELTLLVQPDIERWPSDSYFLLRLLELSKKRSSHIQVLLVDDDNLSRVMCQRYLTNLGINVDTASQGLQAVDMAMQKSYHLIFMDCQMPIMDGFEATRKIRQQSLCKNSPIIALTGLSTEENQQECLLAGMNDVISKPFSQEQLRQALEQWVDKFKHPL